MRTKLHNKITPQNYIASHDNVWGSRKNAPKENCPPWDFFVNFFLSLVFIFMRNFVHKKNLFHSINCFTINLFIIYVCMSFSYPYIFYFQAWHMFIIHICVTSNAGHRYLAKRFFYKQSFFFQPNLSVA